MRPLIAGNWKMNGTGASLGEIACVDRWLAENAMAADVLICLPSTLISRAVAAGAAQVALGGQDCHWLPSGAFTGDISAEMLRDAGASAVIVGHSERRRYHGETNEMIARKAEAAWRAGLFAVVCVGETEAEHDTGLAPDVVVGQLEASIPSGAECRSLAIAYEPVWSIGTGRVPADDEIAGMHALVRSRLQVRFGGRSDAVRVLYGGSIRPENSAAVLQLPNVNGLLVGGASLTAASFIGIIQSAPRG